MGKNTFLGSVLKFIREILVVIIGIAITFTVSNWITHKNEQKDVSRYLHSVKHELENNLNTVYYEINSYEKSAGLAKYLLSDKKENLKPDTIKKYEDVIGNLYTPTFNTSAFETLKTSGAIRLVKNDVLLSSILNSYMLLQETIYGRDKFLQRKFDESYDDIIKNGTTNEKPNILLEKHSSLFNFYATHSGIEHLYKDCAKGIEKTLELFEEE